MRQMLQEALWSLRFFEGAREVGFTGKQAEFLWNALLSYAEMVQKDIDSVPRCDNCGSMNVEVLEGPYVTGVLAPDGGQERLHESGIFCRSCGAIE